MEAAAATEARQAARAWPVRIYSMVKAHVSWAGTGLLKAGKAELRVTAWAMRRTRRGKEQAEEMSGGYFHRHESQNWLPHVVAAIGPIVLLRAVSAMRMPTRAFQHHGLAAVGSCTLPLPPAWLSGCRQQADLTGPACSSAFSRLLLIDQGHSSQNQVRNPIHIQMSLIVTYKCS